MFYIIVIDSGWPTVAHAVLEKSTHLLKLYCAGNNLIFFSLDESQDFMKAHPADIGNEPIILITDVNPRKYKPQKDDKFNGVKIDLGKITDETEAIKYLQELCKLINRKDFISAMSWEERKKISSSFLRDVVGDFFLSSVKSFL